MKKIKSYLILMLAVNFIFGLNLLYDLKKPNTVEAQTCSSIPTVVSVMASCSWTGSWTESAGGDRVCGAGRVMRGRYHTGDENGSTRHLCCSVTLL